MIPVVLPSELVDDLLRTWDDSRGVDLEAFTDLLCALRVAKAEAQ